MMFETEDKRFVVILSDSIFSSIKTYLRKASRNETGGILIGKYSEKLDTALVTCFSDAPKDSQAGPFWFVRGNEGLKELLINSWKRNEYYLGEWHFHPNALPNPSGQDLRQMKKIASDNSYKCPEPILFIVGGNYKSFVLQVFVFPERGSTMYELYKRDRGNLISIE